MGSSLSLILPLIQKDLTVDLIILGWIPTAFVLANAALVLPLGQLADIHGRKKLFAYGVAVYTFASLMAGLANSGYLLVLFSFMQGVGCSLIFATGVALLSSVYPSKKRGGALGMYVTAVYLGIFMGPLIGGLIAQSLGWRTIFLINIPLGIFLIMAVHWKLRGEWIGAPGEKFDYKGSLLYVPSIILLMYGFININYFWGRTCFIAGILMILSFVLMEFRSKNPLLPMEIFHSRVATLSALVVLMIQTATTSIYTLLSLFLQDLRGLSTLSTALILAIQPFFVSILSPFVGRLADKTDYCYLSAAGVFLITIGLIIFLFIHMDSSLITLVIAMVFIGCGIALYASPINKNFMGAVREEIYGQAAAVFSTMIYFGQTLSLGVLLLIINYYMGAVDINQSNYILFMDSFHTTMLVFALIAGLAIFVVLLSKDKVRTPSP